jgi:hypothetical protein
LASVGRHKVRGTMLWFNAAKRLGMLRTEDGERMEVSATAFISGEEPAGRCSGKVVEFDSLDGEVAEVVFVPDPNPRRARRRHYR